MRDEIPQNPWKLKSYKTTTFLNQPWTTCAALVTIAPQQTNSSPPLPPELIHLIAKCAHPKTTEKLRAACKAFRALIPRDDVVWAEAGWRHFRLGLQDTWEWAVETWHTKLIDVYFPEAAQLSHENRRAVILHAASRGDDETLRNITSRVEFTDRAERELVLREALFMAAHGRHPTTVKFLLEAGATDGCLFKLDFQNHRRKSLKFRKHYGAYALDFAYNNADVTSLLLEATTGYTEFVINWNLVMAASKGCEAVVELLLKAGADIHFENDTALEYAVFNSKADMTKKLVEPGANIRITQPGETLLGFMRGVIPVLKKEADRRDAKRTVEVLVAAGAPEFL
ncbi:hypothetical protein HDV00_004368 [Rhizophlyctis rosea]|nr:hypothetical protein HDV00_004368 [Rhizophlyctis rosea]